MSYGTNVVAGISPGKGGEWVENGRIPIFDSVRLASEATGANATIIFVPARYAPDAIYEAIDTAIPLIVVITEGIPVQDMIKVTTYAQQNNIRIVGPNSPGLLSPGESKVGIIPGNIAIPGGVGVISRSGTLTYEIVHALLEKNIGVSTCIGIGGDPVIGTNFIECLELFENDPHTEKIVMIGEIGGSDEEKSAEYISNHVTKPVVAFIAGQSAPPGKRMGHAGAIIDGSTGNAMSKMIALETAGVKVAQQPDQVVELLEKT